MTTGQDGQAVPAIPASEPDLDEPRHRHPGVTGVALGGIFIAAASVGAWLWAVNATTETEPARAGPVVTAVVERGTIAATESWGGTLDHGRPFTVTSGAEGMITRLADQGEAVGRGDEIFRVNEQPVILLYGVVPMFRALGPGDSGADVEQLQANLAELGYEGFTVDGQYTESTAEAVRAWQEEIGSEPTGTVARGDVIFVPDGGRVDALRAHVGDVVAPGTPVLDITGIDQVVSLVVDVDDRDRFEVDTAVTVLLPGGEEIAGTVSATAVVEVRSEGPGGDTASSLQVEIALAEEAPNEIVGAAVEVIVAVDERAGNRHVLMSVHGASGARRRSDRGARLRSRHDRSPALVFDGLCRRRPGRNN